MSVRLITGDCRDVLRTLPDESVHCVVTSPPYWGLRDYGTGEWIGGDPACDHRSPTMREDREEERPALAGSVATNSAQLLLAHRSVCGRCGATKIDRQLGLEPTYQEHVDAIVGVFREVKRVLRKDGTLWLNYGDSYAAQKNGRSAADTKATGNDDRTFRDKPFSTVSRGWNKGNVAGDIRGAPNRSAQAMLKPKDLVGMPWRVAFALQEDGWWLRQDIIWAKPNPMPESIRDRCTKSHEYLFLLAKSERYHFDAEAIAEPVTLSTVERMSQPTLDAQHGSDRVPGKTNGPMKAVLKRSGNKERKPASARGVPVDTNGSTAGAVAGSIPWQGATRNKRSVWTVATAPFSEAHFATFPPALIEPCILAGCPEGGTVLDPFGGAGTTGLVADRLKRNAILIELNPAYVAMAERRIHADGPLLAQVSA